MQRMKAITGRCMSSHNAANKSPLRAKMTLPMIRQLYKDGKPITMLTAYDFPTGRLCESSDVDITLVGDSLAQVCLGYDSTVQLTLDEMIHHCRAVGRGSKSPLLLADMPFGTYFSPEEAIRNAARLMREGGVEGVKLEGGAEVIETVKRLTSYGIPVMGHVGLMPQRHVASGGYHVQGRNAKSARTIFHAAVHLERAGAFAIVVEAIPAVIATSIAKRVQNIPVIGIGAGNGVDGQVLVVSDVLGISQEPPKFSRQFARVGEIAQTAIGSYATAVRNKDFPRQAETFSISREQLLGFYQQTGQFQTRSKAEGSSSLDRPSTEEPAAEESLNRDTAAVESSNEEAATNNLSEEIDPRDEDPMVHLRSLFNKHKHTS
ncbi:hypothetical protein QCA50_004755 [Cerrena zonata]|uniref:3-methyl-2-oxobutanoate hydroxymethyltransferase n=1 Tax=Cerrena zonata TaxID=2478898 RepID=A0AAW0GCV4_9APHY